MEKVRGFAVLSGNEMYAVNGGMGYVEDALGVAWGVYSGDYASAGASAWSFGHRVVEDCSAVSSDSGSGSGSDK